MPEQTVALNRRARHDYAIEETLEAGLVLTGTEIKSSAPGGPTWPRPTPASSGARRG